MRKKILVIVGTRPEVIKTAPVLSALSENSDRFRVLLCASGQHREMLMQACTDFNISPDVNLDVMTANQSLAALSARLLKALDQLYDREKPDAVLVQGDTTTVQTAALTAFYRHIPVGHIEAGLRSHDIENPFPEELNRRIAGLAASWHFAPTLLSKQNLLAENIPDHKILVTGNTVIDALLWMQNAVRKSPPSLPGAIEAILQEGRRIILVTGHRRESFGQGFSNICRALLEVARRFPEDRLIYPVHLNPNVYSVVRKALSGESNIMLCPPLSYKPFVRLMDSCHLIMTDSGGIQEEGPALGKPVLVMRNLTERPEGVKAGVSILVGTKPDLIVSTATRLLSDARAHAAIASNQNPYGDGEASRRIVNFLIDKLYT